MADIRIQALHKRFGNTHTLRGVDLTIADGEFVVFVGPSGCGKSNLLRLIAGLESASSGQIHIGGRDLTHAPASERQLAMVFQSHALYPHLTVRDNLSFGMRMRGLPSATVEHKMQRAVAMLQLQPYLDRRPGELSGGQCQRVEIAALHRELATTMVYVTHDQVEAMTLAQRIVVLRDGAIEQVSTPMAATSQPGQHLRGGLHRFTGHEPVASADAGRTGAAARRNKPCRWLRPACRSRSHPAPNCAGAPCAACCRCSDPMAGTSAKRSPRHRHTSTRSRTRPHPSE